MALRGWARRIATPIVAAVAILYFLIDALFLSLIRPLLERLGTLRLFVRLRGWIESLGPYQSLALFLAPIIVLEPVKPLGLYLLATGHVVDAAVLLAAGEILKMAIVERLFHVARPKLMTIPAFAVAATAVAAWLEWLRALPPWRLAMRGLAALKRRARRLARAVQARLNTLGRGA